MNTRFCSTGQKLITRILLSRELDDGYRNGERSAAIPGRAVSTPPRHLARPQDEPGSGGPPARRSAEDARQRELKHRAAVHGVFRPDTTLMSLDQALRDPQSQ